jgi:hypothetical protein
LVRIVAAKSNQSTNCKKTAVNMSGCSLTFFGVALISAARGFGGIAAAAERPILRKMGQLN